MLIKFEKINDRKFAYSINGTRHEVNGTRLDALSQLHTTLVSLGIASYDKRMKIHEQLDLWGETIV